MEVVDVPETWIHEQVGETAWVADGGCVAPGDVGDVVQVLIGDLCIHNPSKNGLISKKLK